MRHGLTILPEHPWREAAPMWRAAEDLGFDHAWTYDHLVWSGLPDQTWFAAVPTLAAAATVTERIGLGTFVSSPNYRHPYTYARDILTLHDLTEGRFICGVGTGGTLDSGILGETLTVRERVDRFAEYLAVLDRLLRADHVDHSGPWFTTVDARTLPGPVRSSVPLVVAANGPRALRLAAAYGEGWVTTGTGGDDLDAWFQGVAALTARLDDALAATGRAEGFARYLSLDASPRFALQSADLYAEMVGRAGELGFTDVITHWPRPDGPYAGDVRVLETVAATLG
ncbi:MAG TPA: LLM class flavin-dependent oxidoreductase [Dermatophilaceae bacterium]|jgi:alkanesulfonate monooxygenase SsuD/methylene tetrahydromethanopterin reductase-like flavin-dependent oxidoreductase (luciferase family)|uniref:LLM class flavin-dependent oxidoreductase n=1 Tax=Candidatus Phosphoribacter hodrii TaxID=2953743 RepID=A0A9D7T844_9MICO|nr:LLM class flavin-dependent oxidoreductase [Candidatus Phosphoribacter hodrii]MBP8837647.1 LLM class flavin-dependent oxidoreductase [Dermatophilaceae bacterium]OPZ49756.1 MAG: F420-dependent glucose-6-phosphate dehydrogenase [bacterium ADurb.BinA028]HOV02262.1 LLM class flavin-dependent oxidoreductase [Dermatophilaceae bacterium]HQG11454.1 LLM class flavin-dependent oxidoreductase [Dermatophilaceae bacterium]